MGTKALKAGLTLWAVQFLSATQRVGDFYVWLNYRWLVNCPYVDLSLPPDGKLEYTGVELTRDLCEHFPRIKIIILSVHDDENFIARLIEQGAHGYLVKDSDPQEVYEAIVSVYNKGSYINQRTLKAIQHNMGKKPKPILKANDDITKREVEILQLTCKQYTAEEIAEKLFISVKTVNGHRNNLLQKTGSRNVTGLVIYAIKNNLVELI
ncbi:MAG: response regulator transcription factor [Flavobacteriia bacterium]|nr:response regulator transcription factor [Flavobacteriia bacterium]